MAYVVAVDIGGTFTDLVAFDRDSNRVLYTKSPTTYGNFAAGIADCFGKVDLSPAGVRLINHGTTLVINALIQRKGARTALVTTKGFRDVLEIARGNRPDPFDLYYQRDEPLVPRERRFEVDERVDAQGTVLQPLDVAELEALAHVLRAAKVDAVAVCFLHAYANPVHELLAAETLRRALPDVFVTHSVELTREWYEYERTSTAAANAYVGPEVLGYVRHLEADLQQRGFAGSLYLMGSNGGVLTVERTCKQPIALVESGPIGGCIGAGVYAEALGFENVIAFDMGGTTAKCALVENGRYSVESVYYAAGYVRGFPIKSPVIDIVEVGSGGGSIAWLDAQQRLHVGPRSAGSTPGPVCYARGGTEPTVTDANVLLGRIGIGCVPRRRTRARSRCRRARARSDDRRTAGLRGRRRTAETRRRHHRDRDGHDGRRHSPSLGRTRARPARVRPVRLRRRRAAARLGAGARTLDPDRHRPARTGHVFRDRHAAGRRPSR